jgi:hypothetical protein
MAFFEILKLVIGLLPLLLQAIKAVEQAIPDTGKGSEKLELIKGLVQTSYDTSSKLSVSFEQLWPTVQGTVQAIVNAFNKTGTFKK